MASAGAGYRVIPVPSLSDNYTYLLIDDETKTAAAVDPTGPEDMIATAEKEGVKLTHLLTTHKHWDHSMGNATMKERVPGIEVYAGEQDAGDKNVCATKTVKHGDSIKIGSTNISVLDVPCHTRGHVLYVASGPNESQPRALFSGDTLFVAGCGRFFEGSAEEMNNALNKVIAGLPHDTLVYCGHEYTASNLKFAKHVEPNNALVAEKLEWASKLSRDKGEYSIPSTIATELQINPFMRVDHPDVKAFCDNKQDAVEVMAHLRNAKNNFRPPKM